MGRLTYCYLPSLFVAVRTDPAGCRLETISFNTHPEITMTSVVRFPGGRMPPAAQPIPREEFERLADLALDIVDRIVALLDAEDGDPDREDGGDAEPSLGAPEGHTSQIIWLRGGDRDLEGTAPDQA